MPALTTFGRFELPVLARALTAGPVGIEARIVEVQVDLGRGVPHITVVGLPEAAVRESKERVRAAVRNSGYEYPRGRITVNLAPAAMRKVGASYDLAIAAALLAANGTFDTERLEGHVLAGELGLDGLLAPICGALPLAAAAHRAGIRTVILPAQNAEEAALVRGVSVVGARTLSEVVRHLSGIRRLAPTVVDQAALLSGAAVYGVDFADVRGQETARRAFEIAAAGGHNILLIGPPGTGKTMLARRLHTILPKLDFPAALETTAIHSVAGLLKERPLIAVPPFRSPHHTISSAGLIGGGTQPRPGEVALAHNGILFLDELPEFPREALEALREPLEEASVTIARAGGTVSFPTCVTLVAAMNPCPCGHYGNAQRACTCVQPQIMRYRARISGPLLDRIDLHVEVPSVPIERLAERAQGEPSAAVRARVIAARRIQRRRFANRPGQTNARMGGRDLHRYAALDSAGLRLLGAATVRLGLSARAFTRIVKVARTIADLDGIANVHDVHVAEAIQYRSLDRSLG